MFLLNRFLDVYEYSHASIIATNKKKVVPIDEELRAFRVSLIRLATAIAKTMHCAEVSNLELPFMVAEQISALQRHTASFSPGAEGNLRLTDRHFGKLGLRDFSKTTLEGQYAQGLCFLFAQDHLEIPALIDFDRHCDDLKIQRLGSNSSKPDFVACANSQGYWLVESKGNLESDSVKPELKKGIDQCLHGAKHLTTNKQPAPTKSYTTLSSFRTRSSSKSTRLCYVDPDFPDNGREFNSLAFLRRYYERTLKALGYQGNATQIWTDSEAPLFRDEFESAGVTYYRISSADSGAPLFWPLQEFLYARVPDLYSAGVSKELINALSQSDVERYFSLIPLFKEQMNAVNRKQVNADSELSEEWQSEEFFIDGTVVKAY